MNRIIRNIILLGSLAVMSGILFASCDDDRSYAELLEEEDKNVNRFLANQRVVDEIPADSVFQVGEDAPYYRMDDDATVYMQVLEVGEKERPETDDRVYFRFMRYNLSYYVEGEEMTGSGNADDVNPGAVGPTYFMMNNFTNTTSAQWGAGIQIPMRYLGWNAKVNLVIKSKSGMVQEETSVVPYLYTVTYYKPQI